MPLRRSSFDAIKNLHEERHVFLLRILAAAVFCLALSAVLITRLAQVQLIEHDYYSTRSDDNRMRLWVVPPVRGYVFDRHGAVLAENRPAFLMQVNPEKAGDLQHTLKRLSQLVRITEGDLVRFRDRRRKAPKFTEVPLRFNLSMEELASYQVNRYDFEGVQIEPSLSRKYPLGESAAHVIGYIGGITEADLAKVDEKAYRGTNYFGKNGVERAYEEALHGTLGTKIVETNAAGRPLREVDYRLGTPGSNLYLTIDARLQLAAEKAFGDKSGAVVAIEPGTGEILALVSKPGFDPHLFVDGIDVPTYKALNENEKRPLFNRALQGQYAAGSTIKPFIALAGLEARQLKPEDRVFCKGEFTLPGSSHKYRCHKRQGHGWVDLDYGVGASCDIYFYNVALKLGIDRIHAFLSGLGLGKALGVDLPGEKGGLMPSREWKKRVRREDWYLGETLNVGIGQGYTLVTPLQLAQITARLALHGRGFRPRILHAVQDPQTQKTVVVPPEPLPPIGLSKDSSWGRIIETMEHVVHTPGGTAYRIGRDAPYRIAGKTGTVQVVAMKQSEDEAPDPDSVQEKFRDHAVFIAFAPVESPKIAIAVLAEHAGHGGSVAAPVARAVMDAWLLPATHPPVEAAP